MTLEAIPDSATQDSSPSPQIPAKIKLLEKMRHLLSAVIDLPLIILMFLIIFSPILIITAAAAYLSYLIFHSIWTRTSMGAAIALTVILGSFLAWALLVILVKLGKKVEGGGGWRRRGDGCF